MRKREIVITKWPCPDGTTFWQAEKRIKGLVMARNWDHVPTDTELAEFEAEQPDPDEVEFWKNAPK